MNLYANYWTPKFEKKFKIFQSQKWSNREILQFCNTTPCEGTQEQTKGVWYHWVRNQPLTALDHVRLKEILWVQEKLENMTCPMQTSDLWSVFIW